jgi:hypothetical protein
MTLRSHRSPGRLLAGALLAIGAILGAGSLAAAQPPTTSADTQRIEFEPGTDNATRDGTLSPGQTERWLLDARAGQTMAITIDSADNNTVFAVRDPAWNLLALVTATEAESNTFWTGILPADGDYTVEVVSSDGQAYYQMKVWIDAVHMDPLGLVQRISFAPGTDSGSAFGSVIRASTDSWLLTAGAGQTMDVLVQPGPGTGTTFDVFAPDGTPLTAPGQRTTWSGQLPLDGDYRVAVSPLAGNSDYSITVRITGDPSGFDPGNVANPEPTPIVLDGGGVTQRVSFEPGADHAIIVNTLAPGVADTFVLGAAAGQQLSAWITSDSGLVTIAAFDVDGEVLRGAATDVYVEQLPSSGDFELEVLNQGSIVSAYTLTVYIT